jgi:hypothetical protein
MELSLKALDAGSKAMDVTLLIVTLANRWADRDSPQTQVIVVKPEAVAHLVWLCMLMAAAFCLLLRLAVQWIERLLSARSEASEESTTASDETGSVPAQTKVVFITKAGKKAHTHKDCRCIRNRATTKSYEVCLFCAQRDAAENDEATTHGEN